MYADEQRSFLNFSLETAFSKGIKAEKLALSFFQKKGYICLAERFKTAYGEIDLILQKENSLIFVEVKNRPSLEKGLYSLAPRQCARITNAVLFFLQTQQQTWDEMRIDLVAVWGQNNLFHLPNAVTLYESN